MPPPAPERLTAAAPANAAARRRPGLAVLAALLLAATLATSGCIERRLVDPRREPSPASLHGRTVEVSLLVSGGVVLVPTLVDGRGPFWFALDTGATTIVISEDAADLAKAKVEVRQGSIVTEAGRSEGDVSQAMLREIRIGSAGYRFPTAIVMDLESISRGIGHRIDGILGVPVMRSHVWTLDATAASLTIREGSVPADAEGVIALGDDDGLPTLGIDVAGRPMTAILDTGQRMAISVGPDDVGALGRDLPVIGESVGQVLDGEVRRPVARLDGNVTLGAGIVLQSPPVLLGRATRIGMDAFGRRALAIDLRNRRLQVLGKPE